LPILVIRAEALEESVNDPSLRLASDDRWIERLGFRAIYENQIRTLAVALAACKGESKNCHANPTAEA
jgi:hypothetical protein